MYILNLSFGISIDMNVYRINICKLLDLVTKNKIIFLFFIIKIDQKIYNQNNSIISIIMELWNFRKVL